jgi:hypothetical protein
MEPDPRHVQIEGKQSAWARAAMDSEVLIHFETVLESWCSTVDRILHGDFERNRNEGEDSGPNTEFEFWRQRMVKITNLVEQLKKGESRVVLGVLNTAKSKVTRVWGLGFRV